MSRTESPPRGLGLWLAGARPKTLPAAVVPVLVGAAAAADGDLGAGRGLSWVRVLLTMVVSLALQVGVNYANDYSDGIRGTDDDRVGPLRLVGSGLVGPARVRAAALGSFAVAGAAGTVLAALTTWWLVAVGVAAVLAAWGYTGGPKPYGYLGLGELFVFVFFGEVATVGSAYVHTEDLRAVDALVAVPVGILATALLVTNNLRDIPGDTGSGKRTLAVRLGDRATRSLYVSMIGVVAASIGLVAIWRPWAALGLVALPLGLGPIRSIRAGSTGAALIPVLAGTGRLQLATGVLFAAGLWMGS